MKKFSPKSAYSIWYMIPAAVLFTLFFIVPNIVGLAFAFTDWSIFFIGLQHVNFIGFDNFVELFHERLLWRATVNTFYFSFATVIAKTSIGLLLALLLDRELKTKKFLRSVFFIPTIMSPMIVAIVFNAIYNPRAGLLNTFLRSIGLDFMAKDWLTNVKYAMNSVIVMDIWQGVGITMLIFIAGLQTVPKQYYEAAIIDGANSFQKFRHVTLALILPAITVTIVLNMIQGLKVFGQVYGLTGGGPADSTHVLQTFIYKYFTQGLLGYSAAAGLLFTTIILVLSFAVTFYLRRREVDL